MNYIDLLNHFWKINKEFSFTPNEKAVYFALLYKWNDLHRKNPLNQSTEALACDSGVSESTVQRSRKMLKEAGLISFQAGDGRRKNTVYTIHDLTKGSHSEHLSKNKGSQKDSLLPIKGSQQGSHSEYLFIEKPEKKVVTVTDNIDKSIEERIPSIEEEKSEEEEEEIFTQKIPVPIGTSSVYSSMEDVETICLNQSSVWLEHMTRKLNLGTIENAKKWVIEFFDTMKASGQDKRDLNDARQHCYSWIRVGLEREKSSGKKEKGKAEAVMDLNAASTDYWDMVEQMEIINQSK